MNVYHQKKKKCPDVANTSPSRYTVPYLASSMLRVNVSGHWKPGMEDFLGIIYWSLQQVVKILIFRHILVT